VRPGLGAARPLLIPRTLFPQVYCPHACRPDCAPEMHRGTDLPAEALDRLQVVNMGSEGVVSGYGQQRGLQQVAAWRSPPPSCSSNGSRRSGRSKRDLRGLLGALMSAGALPG
jgi:hypothetical protein